MNKIEKFDRTDLESDIAYERFEKFLKLPPERQKGGMFEDGKVKEELRGPDISKLNFEESMAELKAAITRCYTDEGAPGILDVVLRNVNMAREHPEFTIRSLAAFRIHPDVVRLADHLVALVHVDQKKK